MAATDTVNSSEINITTEDNPFTPEGMMLDNDLIGLALFYSIKMHGT